MGRPSKIGNLTNLGLVPRREIPLLHRTPILPFLLFITSVVGSANAQFEVPDEIFQRTVLIRSGNAHATALKLDYAGRIYLVTTRRFGKSLPAAGAIVRLWRNRTLEWHDLQIVRTILPETEGVDLALLETSEKTEKPYSVVKTSEVLTTGEKVWFMGWLANALPPKMPPNMPKMPEIPNYVRIGSISAIDPTRPDSFEISFQGSFIPEIAGGPIIHWSSVHRDFELLGVIKWVKVNEATISPGPSSQSTVDAGRLKGYSIDTVVEALSSAVVRENKR